jgi:hypothetical protein
METDSPIFQSIPTAEPPPLFRVLGVMDWARKYAGNRASINNQHILLFMYIYSQLIMSVYIKIGEIRYINGCR